MSALSNLKARYAALPPRQRQYLTLALVAGAGIGTIWLAMLVGGSGKDDKPSKVTHITKSLKKTQVTASSKVPALDQWVGDAGKKLALFEKERLEQTKAEQERKQVEEAILKRLEQLESKQAEQMPSSPPPLSTPVAPPPLAAAAGAQQPAGLPLMPPAPPPEPDVPALTRISLAAPEPKDKPGAGKQAPAAASVSTFLPVSITRGHVLGGIDAPTGGQAQTNPQPVLIRLADNAILPNRYRSQVRECFVVGAGYGDISSERAYIRTVNLSCVRPDGTTLEVDIKGNVYGEDGKLGMRGRLVTKQGQLLANALRAGIVGGIGQGFGNTGQVITSGAGGTISTMTGDTSAQMQRGVATGIGRALDKLADYYIEMARSTFPIIEIDAGRQVEVVITRGVQIAGGLGGQADADEESLAPSDRARRPAPAGSQP